MHSCIQTVGLLCSLTIYDIKMSSVLSQRPKDCLGCRIVSGSGLIGAGFYVAFHSKRATNNTFKLIMYILATGAVGLGSARLLNLSPFRREEFEEKGLRR